MDPGFKEWVIKDAENLSPKQKEDFLKVLKIAPEMILRIVVKDLPRWRRGFMLREKRDLKCRGIKDESLEILRVYQDHFVAELAAIV